MTKLKALADLGQSVWYDNIRRALIDSGELSDLIDAGVLGITSNPSIFEKAIVGSTDYDQALKNLVKQGNSVIEVYEALAIEDIQHAADLLHPVYERMDALDGYVSIEVNPALAHNTEGTIAEACRLFAVLARPNVMIKVPATEAGIPAIETLISKGININVTLIFSLKNYEAVAEAYIRGLAKRAKNHGDLRRVASVASFFVSRVDSAVDRALDEIGEVDLKGKIAIANAKAAYDRFHKIFSGERWTRLSRLGAQVQRPLWASTSTKNPLYPDTLYVDALIGPQTINTIPPATLQAFRDHGTVARTLDEGLDVAQSQLTALKEQNVDLDAITEKLQRDGVAAFARSFETLLAGIAKKREDLLTEWEQMTFHLGGYQNFVDQGLLEIKQNKIVQRMWCHDHTVWKPAPDEIVNRLGWLHSPQVMPDSLDQLEAFTDEVREAGYNHALLLGMGGSSLAPEMFRKTFGVQDGFLDLTVLDSTAPGAVRTQIESLNLARTLFIVATKSGSTAETLSFFKTMYNLVIENLGEAQAGEHFIAITDPGSALVELADRYGFRATFLNDPNIGGRYSALSYFGLVPASLIGMEIAQLLDRAQIGACGCESCVATEHNPGARLGVAIGELAKAGRDKLTFVLPQQLASFGDWVEQLIAESTGKEGRGILPVVGESLGHPDIYTEDRLFVSMQIEDDLLHDARLEALEQAGHPVIRIRLHDRYDLGRQLMLWKIATALAGSRLGINPFDQPDVEAAKILARKAIAEYSEEGALPSEEPLLSQDGVEIYYDPPLMTGKEVAQKAQNIQDALEGFLAQATEGAYVAVHAYLQPTPENDAALQTFRLHLRDRTKLATTVGYGPRFLHSTGQLHKGDAGRGLFIQITSDDPKDVLIPDQAGAPGTTISFGVLRDAQAMGDRQALLNGGRQVIRFHFNDVISGLEKLAGEQV
jgi:transaldolase/glucose-6-phosphate isomerase